MSKNKININKNLWKSVKLIPHYTGKKWTLKAVPIKLKGAKKL